jgi:hypothetical protein
MHASAHCFPTVALSIRRLLTIGNRRHDEHWGTMQDTCKTPPNQPTTLLGRIGADPSRLMTVREWWYEMDEPISMLSDPQAIFREGERELLNLCLANGIGDRPATSERPAGFPMWLFNEPPSVPLERTIGRPCSSTTPRSIRPPSRARGRKCTGGKCSECHTAGPCMPLA